MRARPCWISGKPTSGGADLNNALLDRAILANAHLEGADLFSAHLEGANLAAAHLMGANLWNAYLGNARLSGAYLERADLMVAHLEGVDLTGATGLTREQIDSAIIDENTTLPDYLAEGEEGETDPETEA